MIVNKNYILFYYTKFFTVIKRNSNFLFQSLATKFLHKIHNPLRLFLVALTVETKCLLDLIDPDILINIISDIS